MSCITACDQHEKGVAKTSNNLENINTNIYTILILVLIGTHIGYTLIIEAVVSCSSAGLPDLQMLLMPQKHTAHAAQARLGHLA